MRFGLVCALRQDDQSWLQRALAGVRRFGFGRMTSIVARVEAVSVAGQGGERDARRQMDISLHVRLPRRDRGCLNAGPNFRCRRKSGHTEYD
jgi:hypothetical protein